MREHLARHSQSVNTQKCQQYTDDKRCDVKKQVVTPDDSRVGVKDDGNQKSAKQRAKEQGRCDTWISVFPSFVHKARIDQHGKKAQFHMLPCGFADRKEKAK